MMESILMLWSKTSAHYSTIRETQHWAWQYTTASRSLSSIRVVTGHIYRMNNCMQWSVKFTLIIRFKAMVQMVNAYLRCVRAQEARAGIDGTDGTTGCWYSNTQGGVVAHWMSVSHGNCHDYSKSSSLMRMEHLLGNASPCRSPQYLKTRVTWIPSRNVYKGDKNRPLLLCTFSAWETSSAACMKFQI